MIKGVKVTNRFTPLEIRFWAKVDKRGPIECWNWLATTRWGYGMIGRGGHHSETLCAHRFSYELLVGPIPSGMVLDHICHNRACVNPAHLRLATRKQNNRNAIRSINNKSGFKGVHRINNGRWRAMINHIHLGYFDTPEEAHVVYCEAAKKYHGEFANFG